MIVSHAIVGCGRVAPCHVDACRELGISPAACLDVDSSRATEFSGRFGISMVFKSFDELLSSPEITSLSLCVPHHLHFPMALQALQAGKHVLVEKPPFLDHSEYLALAEAARSNGRVFMPVSQHRFDPVITEIASLLGSGALGVPRLVRAHLECKRPIEYYRDSEWRGRWETEGGSVLMNQGYHLLDLLILLFGAPTSLSAKFATFQPEIMETEDTLVATLSFRSGALGALTVTGAAGSPWSSYVEILSSQGEVAFTIDSPNAVPRLRLSDKKTQLEWRGRFTKACSANDTHLHAATYYGTSHRNQMRAFVDLIEGRRGQAAPTAEEAAETVAFARDLYESARSSAKADAASQKGESAFAPISSHARPSSGIWEDAWEDLRPIDAEGLTQMVARGETSIISGGLLGRFEQQFASFAGARHSVSFNNGTASLHAGLWALGVRSGDDVLICDYAFHGMAAAVLTLGGRLVICDCDPEGLGLDPAEIVRRRTPRTKAIVLHNPWGMPAQFDRIREAADGIPLISDASHAHGATFRGKPLAAWAELTCFSLGRFKLLSGGELGCAVTDNVELRDRMLLFGHVNRVPQSLLSTVWSGNAVGLKFRPHPAALSLALSQLGRIEAKLRFSRTSCHSLQALFRQYDLLSQTLESRHERSFWKLVLRLGPSWSNTPTSSLEAALRSAGLPVEPNHYWPLLQHQSICNWPDYRKQVVAYHTPNAHRVVPRTITLPAPVQLSNDSLQRTLNALEKIATRFGKPPSAEISDASVHP